MQNLHLFEFQQKLISTMTLLSLLGGPGGHGTDNDTHGTETLLLITQVSEDFEPRKESNNIIYYINI